MACTTALRALDRGDLRDGDADDDEDARRRERREVAQEAIARVHDGGGERDDAATLQRAARHNLAADEIYFASRSVDRAV